MSEEPEITIQKYKVLKPFSFAGYVRNPGETVELTTERAAKALAKQEIELVEIEAAKPTKTKEQ